MIRFFVSVTLPSILAFTAAAAVLSLWVAGRLRAYRAEQALIRAQHRAIRQARDVLAMVISDSLTPDARDQALSAYEALGRLVKEREIS